MDDPNSLKPNTLYSLNNSFFIYKTDDSGKPVDIFTGELGPSHESYRELNDPQSLALQMQKDGRLMVNYGACLERIVGWKKNPQPSQTSALVRPIMVCDGLSPPHPRQ